MNVRRYLIFLVIFVVLGSGVDFVQGATVSVTKMPVSVWNIILFQGDGMHRLHNVEITISNQKGFDITLMTQATDRGIFYTPWIMPESLEAGTYNVVATDHLHTAITTFEIGSSDSKTTVAQKTILTLHDIQSPRFNEGQPIVFQGKLTTESYQRVTEAKIVIEKGESCSIDCTIASGLTDKYGKFFIKTPAKVWDPTDNMIIVHAEFLGNEKFSPAVSDNQIVIVYPL